MTITELVLDEADIRRLLDQLGEAIRIRDLERIKACFVADMVSFDFGPLLRYVGVEAKLNNWRQVFEVLQPPIGYVIRDLKVVVGKDVAFAYGIIQLSGTLNGDPFAPWVRWTAGLYKTDGGWLIAHDQVSPPVDESGRAVLDLDPDSSW